MSRLEELIQELCPDGVERFRIDEICDISRGRVMSKEYIKENQGDYPVYSSQTENNGELGCISTYDFDGEYLTWTTDGANAGTVFYRLGRFSVTNVCGLLSVKNKKVMTKYLYYALNWEAPAYVNKGMGNPKLMSNVMARIRVFIPPLQVQEEIVRILDSFVALIMELHMTLKEEQKIRKQQFEFYRDILFLGNNEFKMKRLGDTCYMKAGKAIKTGILAKEKDEEHQYPCFGGNGIRGYMKEASHRGEYPIIGRQGALCGNVNYATGEFYATEHAVVVESLGEYDQRFLFYLLTVMNLNQYKSQGAQPGLAVSNIENIMAPVPELEQQRKIVDYLDQTELSYNRIDVDLSTEIEARQKQYEYYRDKLLTFKERTT